MTCTVLLLPNHGNEPYLLGISIALKIGVDFILVPHYYNNYFGEPDQQHIIKNEFPGDCHKIYLSQTLGKLLKPIIRSSHDNRSYPQYVKDVFEDRKGLLGIDHVSQLLKEKLNNGIKAFSVANQKEERIFYLTDIDFEFNIGLPIVSPIDPSIYVFTSLMSEVYRNPLSSDVKHELVDFAYLAAYWEEIEEGFEKIFIPKINALSHLSTTFPKVIYTPPLAKIINPKGEQLSKESILLIPSGTGQDKIEIDQLVHISIHGYELVSYSKKVRHVKKVTTSVFADDKLMAVISRGGWGTIWKCLVHNKPMGYFSTVFQEDPEIAHTLKTLTTLDIGFLVDPLNEQTHFPSRERIDELNQNISKIIGNEKNGIDFISNQIIQQNSIKGRCMP
ncbi:MAG TPA: hypothetical protein VF338_08960, partial [Leptolinea sp.]